MPTTNFIVSSLPAYVQTNRDIIIKSFALVGTDTRRRISLQTGVKGSAYLNFLDLAPVLQDGSSCGFSAADEITLTQRTVVTAPIKVNGQICPKTLLGKYAEYLVRINATENDLPFEQYIVDALVAQVNKKIEKLIWQGDHTQTSDADKKWIDGFIYQFDNDASVIDVSIASGKTAYEGLVAVYLAMPEETIERGGRIFVSPAIYRAFLQDLVTLNYFHYAGAVDSAPEEFVLPGSDVRVIKTPGLAGVNKVVGTFADNLVYACDVEGDNEDIDLWWSQDDRLFKYAIEWNSGVSYHFSDQVVLGAFAADPSATVGNAAALKTIAANSANIKDYSTAIGTIASKTAGLDNLADIKTSTGALADADHVYKTKEQA